MTVLSGREQAVREQVAAIYESVLHCCTVEDVDDPNSDRFCENFGCTNVVPLARSMEWLLARVDELTAALQEILDRATTHASDAAARPDIAAIARAALAPVSVPEAAKEEA